MTSICFDTSVLIELQDRSSKNREGILLRFSEHNKGLVTQSSVWQALGHYEAHKGRVAGKKAIEKLLDMAFPNEDPYEVVTEFTDEELSLAAEILGHNRGVLSKKSFDPIDFNAALTIALAEISDLDLITSSKGVHKMANHRGVSVSFIG